MEFPLVARLTAMVSANGASARSRALHACLSSGVPAPKAAADAPLRMLRLMCA